MNPDSLEKQCLETIVENIHFYIKNDGVLYQDQLKTVYKYRFKDENVFFIAKLSDSLLQKLMDKKQLTNSMLQIFTRKNTNLKTLKVKINHHHDNIFGEKGIQILKEHNLISLQCNGSSLFAVILENLNEWTINNLQIANFFQIRSINEHFPSILKFKNLKAINLSNTKFGQDNFSVLCEQLKFLININISETEVTDLTPILNLKTQIKILGIAKLKLKCIANIILQLINLEKLDVSEKPENAYENLNLTFIKLLSNSPFQAECLPKLKYLDISWANFYHKITKEELETFLKNKPNFRILGNLQCDQNLGNILKNISLSKNIEIAGLINKNQIITALRIYIENKQNILEVLCHLKTILKNYTEDSTDYLPYILKIMETYTFSNNMIENVYGTNIQIYSIECLHSIFEAHLQENIHPTLLSKAVNLIINALLGLRRKYEITRIGLFTLNILCKDALIHKLSFNRFHAALVLFDNLGHYNPDIRMMTSLNFPEIFYIRNETPLKKSDVNYMKKLTNTFCFSKGNGPSYEFLFNLLCNLAESPVNSALYLEYNGKNDEVNCFVECREVIKDVKTTLQTYVDELDRFVKLDDSKSTPKHWLSALKQTPMSSRNFGLSYFVMGLLVHMNIFNEKNLNLVTDSDLLVDRILEWGSPESQVICFTSFKPLLPFLDKKVSLCGQLWALWTIRHLCNTNGHYYCPMLAEINGKILLENIVECAETDLKIRTMAEDILSNYCSI